MFVQCADVLTVWCKVCAPCVYYAPLRLRLRERDSLSVCAVYSVCDLELFNFAFSVRLSVHSNSHSLSARIPPLPPRLLSRPVGSCPRATCLRLHTAARIWLSDGVRVGHAGAVSAAGRARSALPPKRLRTKARPEPSSGGSLASLRGSSSPSSPSRPPSPSSPDVASDAVELSWSGALGSGLHASRSRACVSQATRRRAAHMPCTCRACAVHVSHACAVHAPRMCRVFAVHVPRMSRACACAAAPPTCRGPRR